MSVLIKSVLATKKPVLEIGSGLFSTPLLHWMCKDKGLRLYTYENVKEYLSFSKQFMSKTHRIRFVKDWNKVEYPDLEWGVVLIDHGPAEQRHIDAIKFADKADYVILHDSDEDIYEYDKVYPYFKYRYDWKECKPWTTVLSNFKEL